MRRPPVATHPQGDVIKTWRSCCRRCITRVRVGLLPGSMDSRTLLLLLSLVGCGLCSWRPIDLPGVEDDWPPMPVSGIEDQAVGDSAVCDICVVIVGKIQEILSNHSTEVIDFLDDICAEFPAEYVATCKEYVKEWVPIVIDYFENQTPDEICKVVGLCTNADIPKSPRLGLGHLMRHFQRTLKRNFNRLMIKNALGNDILCDGCNEVVSILHAELTDKQVLDEIAVLLAEGCAYCPVEEQCRTFFENLPGEIEAFANEYLNNQTCKDLGFCTSGEADVVNQMDILSDLFSGFLPDNLDADLFSRRPWFRPRPRPNTEPAPRPRPSRPFFRPGRHGPGQESHNHGRPEDREHHYDRRNDRPHHSRWHPRPDGRDRPHRGPRPDDRPVPEGVRPWWKPGKQPFWPRPSGGKPTLPDESMVPEVEIPEFEVPEVEIPEVEIPEVEIPEVEIPEVEIPQITSLDVQPEPRDPSSSNFQDGLPRPHVNSPWNPKLGITKDGYPMKPFWPAKNGKGNRKQRSVRISTVVKTDDFDPAMTYDVEPVNEQPVDENVEGTWQCDVCEYEVDILQKYLEDHKDAINAKLIAIADLVCDRLPATTAAECKTEVAELLPSIVDMIIEDDLTPESVCTAIKVC